MYENAGGQRLTVYLRADAAGETRFRYVEAGGIGAFYWIDDGFGYAVSGAPDRRALLRIAEAVYHQTAEAPEQGQPAQTPQLR
jgi:anti-sigma factor RsiW